jgi:hypothetical protein
MTNDFPQIYFKWSEVSFMEIKKGSISLTLRDGREVEVPTPDEPSIKRLFERLLKSDK